MTKKFNSIRFIDALAEITSHDDREVIERSLLETLCEFQDSREFWLYQILTLKPELSLGLLAFSSSRHIITSEHAVRQKIPDFLYDSVTQAISSSSVQSLGPGTDNREVYNIYPSEDQRGEVFAVLIEKYHDHPGNHDQRMVHGFLRVYSNYLRLLELNRRDKLTGLFNRETLDLEITRTLILNSEKIPHGLEENNNWENDQRINKGELKTWLGVLDIDHFKLINDTYGHLYGDEILILVARLMEKSVRNYDLVFRYGGEEFVILLRATNKEIALQGFERIRNAVGHHDYAKAEQVTVSIGFTEILNQTGPADVIAEADKALYFAKENGRDQVRYYSDLIDEGAIESPEEKFESGGISYF
jgi:two-component system cell cycle response regulator